MVRPRIKQLLKTSTTKNAHMVQGCGKTQLPYAAGGTLKCFHRGRKQTSALILLLNAQAREHSCPGMNLQKEAHDSAEHSS